MAAAACWVMLALRPGVKETRGGWLGTLWVIFTFFLPSSVKISVNWLMYRVALERVPSSNLKLTAVLNCLKLDDCKLLPAGAAFLLLLSVVSLDVELSYVLVIGGSLQYRQPGVVDSALAPLRRLQDVLTVQLGRHVCRILFLWKRTHEPLYINLHMTISMKLEA